MLPTKLFGGVLFNIDAKEKTLLNNAEGLGSGYNEETLTFYDEFNNPYSAQVYIADSKAIDNNLLSYDWYKEFIITGAIQNQLSEEHIALLQSIPCASDPDEKRSLKNYSILSGK